MTQFPTLEEAGNIGRPANKSDGGALFVDLDGTLIDGDLLGMAAMSALKRPTIWPVCALGLWYGRAAFKETLSEKIHHAPGFLPYRTEVLAFIRQRRTEGYRLVLATATAARWAIAVAEHLGCFDDVLSSTPKLNLKGLRKLSAIQEYCRLHDIVSFGYVGDSAADLPIWQAADELFIVAPRRALLGRIRKLNRAYVVLGSRSAPASETA